MDRLNYHHLLYFWMVAREGTIARASAELRLSQPAVSGQIRALEQAIGERLFERAGRRLRLTSVGQVVFEYAQGIFTLGRDLTETLAGRSPGRPLRIGVADVVPKLISYRLIQPALRLPGAIKLTVREDHAERLFAELALHRLDVVITDAPAPQSSQRLFSHLLGESTMCVLAAEPLAKRLRRSFPTSLEGQPFLLPSEGTSLRRALDDWFRRRRLAPRTVGEFDDTALIKIFGADGAGAFVVPEAVAASVVRQYGVRRVGVLTGVVERFYAVTAERKLMHPAVTAISEAAQNDLFG
jgi:LysR family transcriptional activator of nhaA